jgi:predicted transposase YbfD/YdcC
MPLIEQLKQIPDPRHIKGRRHPLWMILFFSLLGFLCGYAGYRPLADFCRQHPSSLRSLLGLPAGQAMPSYSTFRRSFLHVSPQGWIETFNHWAVATLPASVEGLLSLDGKSIRCTSTGGNSQEQNFVSFVSLYGQQVGVVQLLMMENKKCSEIHVAQALIAQLPALPPGQCLSFDALHTTQATVKAVNATQQDYLLALKPNRAETYVAVETLTQTEPALASAVEQDNSHGRSVQRQVQVFAPTPKLQAKYACLTSIGVLTRTGIRDQRSFCETVYYLSSRFWSASDLLHATRQHWQIENGLHWVKDVTFKEDDPVRRGGQAPVNWAVLNTFCITLARRQGWRTVPQALRSWANQLHQVFHFLV